MPSPVVAGVAESSTNTAGTSHALNWTGLGTVAAGDLLIIILDKGSTAATVNAHTDWTELLDENLANGLYIAYRWAVGGETAPTLTTSASTRSAEITYRITGAANPATQAPQIGTTATGTSATPDPPASATPGSTKDFLFITFYGAAGEEADDDTWSDTPPTNYTPSPPRQKSCGTAGTNLGGLIAAAERALTTGSAENPGTFAKDVSVAWRAQTIMIHPDPNVSLAAGQNTVTVTAPDVPAVPLTMPQTVNTITVSAPAQTELHAVTLAAGQNTITVSAPAQTELHAVTLAAGQNTITVSAPAQSQLAEITLAAGQNTITVSAPAQSQLAEITLAAGANTVAVTAPDATGVFDEGSTNLAAGQNTVTVSAPTIPAVHLTIPQTVNTITVSAPEETILAETTLAAGQNTITVSAPAQSQLAEITLAAGQNTITVSAPAQSQLAEITLAAGANTVTVSAPVVPAVNLTMPQTVNTVTVTSPVAELIQAGNLLAEVNTITVSAPTVPAVHLTIPVTTNTITVTAPEETVLAETALAAEQSTVQVSAPTAMLFIDSVLSAGDNTVTVSAPVLAGVHLSHVLETNTVTVTAPTATVAVTFDSILTPGVGIITVYAPIVTVQPQYGGNTVYRETAKLRFTQHETLEFGSELCEVRLPFVRSETRRTKLD